MIKRFLPLILLAAFAPFAHADTYYVSNTNDSGSGSLRQAILDANAHPGPDLITQTATLPIVLKSPLPAITDPARIGFATGVLSITLDGRGAGAGANGLVIAADDCWIFGVFIGGFDGAGIVFRGKRGAIDTAFLGIDRAQNPLPNGTGIRIDAGGDVNIGAGNKVFIYNNRGAGIDARGNVIITSAQVTSNGGDGIHIDGATSIVIAPDLTLAANGGAAISIANASNTNGAALTLAATGGSGAFAANAGPAVTIDGSHDLKIVAAPKVSHGVIVRDSTNIDLSLTETNAAADGVHVERSSNVVVRGSVAGSGGDGVRAIDSDVVLSGTVSASHGHGVSLSGGTLVFTPDAVSSSPMPAGVTGNGGDGVHVEHGKVTGIALSTLNRGDGIALLDHSDGSTLGAGTYVTSNGGVGVRVDQTANCALSMNTHDNLGGPVIINGSAANGNLIKDASIEVHAPDLHGVELGPRKGRAGVLITGGASNNRITKTSIGFQNGPAIGIESGTGNHVDALDMFAGAGPPIDLGLDGVSVATTGGAGANALQPAPVLEKVQLTTAAASTGNTFTISGLIPGSHGGSYDLDVYSVPNAEWHTMATIPIVADGSGHFSTPFTARDGLYYLRSTGFAATVTDAAGNTSEMSAPRGAELRTVLEVQTGDVARGDTMLARIDRIGSDLDRRATADWVAEWYDASTFTNTPFASGSVTFEPGETRKNITVDTKSLASCSCTRVGVSLRNITGAVAGDSWAANLLAFDDRKWATIPAKLNVPEGDVLGAVIIPVTRYHTDGLPMTVAYHTEAGTAKEGEDFVAVHGTITMAPDQREALIAVPIRGDQTAEADETFKFVIQDRYNGVSTCTITLTDDDSMPAVDAQADGNGVKLITTLGSGGEAPHIFMDLVRITPWGEVLLDHTVDGFFRVPVDTKQGPLEIRLTSDNAKVLTPVVRLAQAANALAVSEHRVLRAGTTEQIRVARLSPADVPLDMAYTVLPFHGGSSTGMLHFNPGETIATISAAIPPLQAGLTDHAYVTLQIGNNTQQDTLDIVSEPLPLLVVSNVLRDAGQACITFDSAGLLPATTEFNVRGDWQSMSSQSTFDFLRISAGGTHVAYCTTHSASTQASWVNIENTSNARFSTNRVWIGIDPYTSNGLPQSQLRFFGGTVEEPRSGTGYADFVITNSYPATPMQFEVETVDGTAIAGRDYTPVVTSVGFIGGQTRATVRIPILAAGGTPPEGKYFFVSVRGQYLPSIGGAVTIVPAGKGPGRRRS